MEKYSPPTRKSLPSRMALYASMALSIPQTPSSVDFAKPRLIILEEATSPTKIC